jgi:DNA-directed RNA polymerase subunit RPC12/RpoP
MDNFVRFFICRDCDQDFHEVIHNENDIVDCSRCGSNNLVMLRKEGELKNAHK